MTAEWMELLKTLGVASPLVVILLYLLKEATKERQAITTAFLDALKTTVEQSNEQRLRTSNELAELTHALRDDGKRAAEEHGRIVDAIDKLDLRRHVREG